MNEGTLELRVKLNILGKRRRPLHLRTLGKETGFLSRRRAPRSFTFELDEKQHCYITAHAGGTLNDVPGAESIAVAPETEYRLTGNALVDGSVALWVVEYSSAGRIADHRVRLRRGAFALEFKTGAESNCICIALRLQGRGSVSLDQLSLGPATATPLRVPSAHARRHVNVRRGEIADALRIATSTNLMIPSDASPVVLASPSTNRREDTFDHLAASLRVGEIYRLYRPRLPRSPRPIDRLFLLDQLEVHWQDGSLAGVIIDPSTDPQPDADLLTWLEQRNALLVWENDSPDHIYGIETILHRISSPVALWVPAEQMKLAATVVERFPHAYTLVHPANLIGGSDLAGVVPEQSMLASGGNAPIARYPHSEIGRDICVENLAKTLEATEERRRVAMSTGQHLRFPPLPATEEDLRDQGFVIVEDHELSEIEGADAKKTWSAWGVKSFYEDYKPWAGILADLVDDLGCQRILEFGCNVGRNLISITNTNPSVDAVGIDINKEAIDAGRTASGLDLRVGDERSLREFPDGAFDLVFTVSVLDHIPDIDRICRELVRCSARYVYLLEVRLPVQGKIQRHFDHRHRGPRDSTQASYSWHLERILEPLPRVRRIDRRRVYLHDAQLGPYYEGVLVHCD